VSGKASRGFTLVELLVVVAIIVILMSILLPVLKVARTTVGVGMCAKQIRDVGQGFHAYLNEFSEKLPWVAGTANLAMIDGSARAVMDVPDNQPTKGQILRHNVDHGSCRDDAWFCNNRAPWLFWRWYGPGNGL